MQSPYPYQEVSFGAHGLLHYVADDHQGVRTVPAFGHRVQDALHLVLQLEPRRGASAAEQISHAPS